MYVFFLLFVAIMIGQRLVELWIARRNEKWMKANGAIEVGKEHYKYIVLVHTLFFISLIVEVLYFQKELSAIWGVFFVFFIAAQLLRVWSLQSLGRFWNTKIIILPNVNIICKGPYKYIRHPNYLVVVIELLVVPLIFGAYWTSVVFSLLNLIVLSIRIPAEEQALMEQTNYKSVFVHRSRFTPSK